MPFFTRISIALLCAILAVGNCGAVSSLWCDCDSESETGDVPEPDNETDSIELALPGWHDPLSQLASQTGGQPSSQIAIREPSFAITLFTPPTCLSVGTGTGGPLRC